MLSQRTRWKIGRFFETFAWKTLCLPAVITRRLGHPFVWWVDTILYPYARMRKLLDPKGA